MLIDRDFFWGNLDIPNITPETGVGFSGKVIDANISVLSKYIEKYEKAFLSELLGELGESFIKSPDSPEYISLREILIDSAGKTSPIANYVYFWYRRNYATLTTDVGEVITDTDNSTVVSPDYKLVAAWNEMVDMLLVFERKIAGLKQYNYKRLDCNLFTKINELGL